MAVHTLTISTGTSRARDTYGWNIVRLTDSDTRKTYRTCGGGYDMTGTVLADWLQDTAQAALLTIRHRAYDTRTVRGYTRNRDGLYGMTTIVEDGETRVALDGACGVESILRVAEAAGVTLDSLPLTRTGSRTGWVVA